MKKTYTKGIGLVIVFVIVSALLLYIKPIRYIGYPIGPSQEVLAKLQDRMAQCNTAEGEESIDICLIESFVDSGIFMCDKLHLESLKYQCLALKNRDPEICKNLTGKLTYYPVTGSDFSKVEQVRCRNNILIYRAEILENNSKFCDEMFDSYDHLKDQCYDYFGLCEKISDSFTRAECRRDKIRRQQGITVEKHFTWTPAHQYQ